MMGPTMIDVGGVMGADATSDKELLEMFADDPKGTLGWLQRPWQDAAAVFRYDAKAEAWTLLTRSVLFLADGQGASGDEVGFSGEQTEDATSLLPSGHSTGRAYFTLRGVSLRFSPLGYAPASSAESAATKALVVSRDGVLREDTARLAETFASVLFGSSMLELFQQTRKCFAVLGRAETFRAEAPVPFKRVFVLPPGGDDTPQYVIRMKTARSLAIPRDKNFPAPEDGALAAFTVTLELDGYCTTADGAPLVTPTDNAEGVQAVAHMRTATVLSVLDETPNSVVRKAIAAKEKAAARKPAKKLPKAA